MRVTRTLEVCAAATGASPDQMVRTSKARPQDQRIYAARALATAVLQRFGVWTLSQVAAALGYERHPSVHELLRRLEAGDYDHLMPNGETGVETAHRLARELAVVGSPPVAGRQAAAFRAELASAWPDKPAPRENVLADAG